MDLGVFLLLWLGALFAVIYLMIMGPSQFHRNGLVGRAHDFVFEDLPPLLWRGVQRVFGSGISRVLGRAGEYCCHTAHPVLQLFYLVLLTGSVYTFFAVAWSDIPNEHLGAVHKILIPAAIGATYLSFYAACTVSPGAVTVQNAGDAVARYEFDYLLYRPKVCKTCKLPKPARSKHCSLCGSCVRKHDHHCAWINNCVGERNFRLFLLFIAATMSLGAYGAYLATQVFRARHRRLALRGLSMQTRLLVVLSADAGLAVLGFFAAFTAVLLLCFLLYQLHLATTGVTQNESFKRDELQWAFRQNRTAASGVPEGRQKKPQDIWARVETCRHVDAASVRAIADRRRRRRDIKDTSSSSSDEDSREQRVGVIDEEALWDDVYAESKVERPAAHVRGTAGPAVRYLVPVTEMRQVRHFWDRGVLSNLADMLFVDLAR